MAHIASAGPSMSGRSMTDTIANGAAASARQAPHRARAATPGVPREVNGRIFHTAFYAADKLNQIAEFLGFDRDFYLSAYPESAVGGGDPIRHFLGLGIDETRLPSNPAD